MARVESVSAKRELTTLEYALLGIVSLGEKSAYDIRQLFVDTPMTQFSSSPGSIYPALRRLEDQGVLASELERGRRGRNKRIYRATRAGLRRLDAWLRRSPDMEDVRTGDRTLFLRFSLMQGRIDDAGVLQFLDDLEPLFRAYRAELQAFVDRFRKAGALQAELAALHGVMAFSTHLEWLAIARTRLRD